ncbi:MULTISPECIES: LysR substrate-binding domain-containing protein [Micrococcaceae]|uniref:LysR substrate-binding domain-containing protein n=1 Tax=Micrococcaceae TaxID=1268 RepID=UPI001609826F|nr:MULTISPECIES: LysR substrate-binding domain-containing protein [Micrococcaceae]MBB5750028.1 DNA-binding transcriptional LysR family regulator [Micrococcus sp. TA1]HRO30723.1 LysR substrate-binding domain-containing protein [Citricoccus sp.]HRO94362.1 LysR substrate-binding domain-containing protein [Citricoccus sp.]
MDPFRFTLRQLQHFLAATDAGTVTAAAESVHISQAAMSQSLTELERAVGQQLMVRTRSHGIQLTSAGRRFLVDARELVRRAADVQQEMADRAGQLVGPLSIGCYTAVAPFWVPFIAERFIVPHPEVSVQIVEGDGRDLQRQMLEGRFDAVITHTGHLIDGVHHEVIRRGQGYALVHPGHRLASREAVEVAEFGDDPFVLLDVPAVRDNQIPKLRALGLEPNIRWRSTSLEAVRGLVGRGLGWSVLVQRPPVDMSYDGFPIVPIPLLNFEPSDICFAYVQERRSRRLRELISLCTAEGARLDEQMPSGRAPGHG